MMKLIKAKKLTKKSFNSFGKIIEKPKSKATVKNGPLYYWHNIQKEIFNKNITIAYLKITKQPLIVKEVERHEFSPVIFIPLEGDAVMLFAPSIKQDNKFIPDISKAKAFHIENSKVFLVNSNIWYSMALTDNNIEFLCIASEILWLMLNFIG